MRCLVSMCERNSLDINDQLNADRMFAMLVEAANTERVFEMLLAVATSSP